MFKCDITTRRAIFATLALIGIILLNGCGGLNQSPLAPDRAAVAQKGSGKTYVNPKAAKVVARKDTTSTSVTVKGQCSANSSYSLGDDILPPEGGNP